MSPRTWILGLSLIVTAAPPPSRQSAPPVPNARPAPEPAAKQEAAPANVALEFVSDEADAVLALVGHRHDDPAAVAGDWARLLASDGYRRLKRREAAIGAPITDAEFRVFVESKELAARAADLAATLARWREADPAAAARRALAYLPAGAHIHARILPVIKPRDNTFVFEPDTDPAIFFSLDPALGREKFENTLAHELHHIGYASCCPTKEAAQAIEKLAPRVRTVFHWIGAFGEGFAMLAAAGGPDVHPHAVSDAAERARWDHDVARFDDDLAELESFFLDILEGRLADGPKLQTRAMSYFGVQGPWYTVGWKMSVTIERAFGRERLLECMVDPRRLLTSYDDAVDELATPGVKPPATWSAPLLNALEPK
jgi:hypothetical protein